MISFYDMCLRMLEEGALERYAAAPPEFIDQDEEGNYLLNFKMPAPKSGEEQKYYDYKVKMRLLPVDEMNKMLNSFARQKIDYMVLRKIERPYIATGIKIYEVSLSVNGSMRPKDSTNPFAAYTRLFGALKSLVDMEKPQGIAFLGSTDSLQKMYDVFYREIMKPLGYVKVYNVYMKSDLMDRISSLVPEFAGLAQKRNEKDDRSVERVKYAKRGLPLPPHLSGEEEWDDGEVEKA